MKIWLEEAELSVCLKVAPVFLNPWRHGLGIVYVMGYVLYLFQTLSVFFFCVCWSGVNLVWFWLSLYLCVLQCWHVDGRRPPQCTRWQSMQGALVCQSSLMVASKRSVILPRPWLWEPLQVSALSLSRTHARTQRRIKMSCGLGLI